MNIILFEEEKIPNKIALSDTRAKHLIKILKLKVGDNFKCGLVNGPSGVGTVQSIESNCLYFTWAKSKDFAPLYPLTLLIGFTRPISSKRILREAASLGVEKMVFVGTDTGEKSYRDSTLWKGEYKQYLIDGAQQAASTGLPEIIFYKDLPDFFAKSTGSNINTGNLPTDMIVLDNILPNIKLSEYNPDNTSCLLAIGSERGWSERERTLFRRKNFIFASLGNRVLRTETASTAGITLLLSRMGII
ncbi:MAG: 16S rRNA (uracil(1498)-N(3))-methyltransferase [Spirochaetaceae bacterium]|nr:16S rRNA (uracil(1498)-N(3))-methyltransferase [Spirochaetaceae bacterium]